MSFLGDLFKIIAIGAFFIATGPFGLSISSGLATALRIGGIVAGYIGSLIDRPHRLHEKQRYDMAIDPGVPVPVVYGRARVPGIAADWMVDKSTDEKILYMAVPFAHGSRDGLGIKAVDQIWVNGLKAVTVTGDLRESPFTTHALDYQLLLGTTVQNAGDTNLTGLTDVLGAAPLAPKALSDVTENYETGRVAITSSAQTNTINTASAHGYSTNDRVRISGHIGTYPQINREFTITVTGASQFTISGGGFIGNGSGGSVVKLVSQISWSATTDTGKGLALALFRLRNVIKTDDTGPTYQGPPNISFIVQGNRIYDTRTDTWVAGGTNPAMCIRDYLLSPIYGCGFAASLIHEDSFIAAADHCDTSITVELGWFDVSVVSSSVANPTVITTTAAHRWVTGNTVRIAGHTGSTPSINGDHVITVTGATTFTIPVNVTVGGTGGSVVRLQTLADRYTCNGVVDTSRSLSDNLQELLSSCRGNLVWEQGQFKLTIRHADVASPTLTLSPSNILGEWSFRNAGLEDKWNLVKASYIDPMNGEFKVQDVQWPRVGTTNNYLTADNGFPNRLELSLPFTNDQAMAQTIAQITLNEARLGISVQMRCTEEALAASVGDRVKVTHPTPGWTNKEFWVTAMQLLPDSTVSMSLQEFDTTAYSLSTMEDLRSFPATSHDSIFIVPPPGAVTGTAISGGGLLITWGSANYGQIDFYEVQAKCSSCGDDYATIARVRETTQTPLQAIASLARPGQTWLARVRVMNVVGQPSNWVESSAVALPSTSGISPGTGAATWTGFAPTVTGGSAAPDLTSVGRTPSGGDLCNDSTAWIQTVNWTTTGANDAAFQIDIQVATDSGGTSFSNLVTGLTTSSSSYANNTGIWCKLDPPGTTTTYYRKYRVRLIRKSDGAEIEHLDTTQDTITCRSGACL